MKCKNCKAEMDLWQTTRQNNVTIKKYRCVVCSTEDTEIIGKEYKTDYKKDK